MTFGNKLAKMRRENNYTQEQLADILGVSRQSISKWESDIAFPETEKIIRLSQLFGCTTDYLLKDDDGKTCEAPHSSEQKNDGESGAKDGGYIIFRMRAIEKKSDKTLCGMPLYHIAKNARGFFAVGLNAKGVFAVGLKAQGVVSLGLLSIGILSLGLLSIGIFAMGVFALGLFSSGAIALGILAAGAISLGVLSVGAIAVGQISAGALSVGQYFALGDWAYGDIAIGYTKAVGTSYQYIVGEVGYPTGQELIKFLEVLEDKIPAFFEPIKQMIKHIVGQ